MFKNIVKGKLWVVIALSGIFIFSSFSVFAWEHHDSGGHHGGGYHFREGRWYRSGWFGLDLAVSALALGAVVASLPGGHTTVVVDGMPYYYYDDVYYRPVSGGYVVVDRPAAIAREIPVGYQPTVINGVTYYLNNGVYYIYTPYGYQVVQPPAGAQNPSVPVKVSAPSAKEEPLIINVPNSHGGFTPVKLIKHKGGFVGPQGEYYEHPTVDQLKALYGE